MTCVVVIGRTVILSVNR